MSMQRLRRNIAQPPLSACHPSNREKIPLWAALSTDTQQKNVWLLANSSRITAPHCAPRT